MALDKKCNRFWYSRVHACNSTECTCTTGAANYNRRDNLGDLRLALNFHVKIQGEPDIHKVPFKQLGVPFGIVWLCTNITSPCKFCNQKPNPVSFCTLFCHLDACGYGQTITSSRLYPITTSDQKAQTVCTNAKLTGLILWFSHGLYQSITSSAQNVCTNAKSRKVEFMDFTYTFTLISSHGKCPVTMCNMWRNMQW
jgi:hypothetical protein